MKCALLLSFKIILCIVQQVYLHLFQARINHSDIIGHHQLLLTMGVSTASHFRANSQQTSLVAVLTLFTRFVLLAYCWYFKKNHPFQTLQCSWILSEAFGFVSKHPFVTLVLATLIFIYETTKYDYLYFPSWKMDPWKDLLSTPMCPGQLPLPLFRCQPGRKCLLLLHSEARLTSDSVSLEALSNFITWCVFIYLRLSFLMPLIGTTCFRCSDESMTLKFCPFSRADEKWHSPSESRPRRPLCQENSLQLEPEEAVLW